MDNLVIRFAKSQDSAIILFFIKELAAYEKLSHKVIATENDIINTIFSENSNTEVLLAFYNHKPVAFAVFFHNYSTFLGKKGLYLEDLFVIPEFRGKGIGKRILKYLAQIALERNCGRFEWSVLDWNEPAIKFYENIGAQIKKEWLLVRMDVNSIHRLANMEEK